MMASKTRNRAGMDAEAVARMMAEQDQAEREQEASTADPVPTEASPPVQAEPPPAAPVVKAAPPPPVAPQPTEPAPPPAWDPGKIDGRTLRRTGREPFATRIKPETHEALRRLAYHRKITIAEALEMAVAAFERS